MATPLPRLLPNGVPPSDAAAAQTPLPAAPAASDTPLPSAAPAPVDHPDHHQHQPDRPPPANPPPVGPPPNHRLIVGPLYNSLEEIDADVKHWARTAGFGVVHTSLKKSGPGPDAHPIRVDYACVRGRIRPSTATVRRASTRKTDCRWGAHVAVLKKNGGSVWSFGLARHAQPHNHEVAGPDDDLDVTQVGPMAVLGSPGAPPSPAPPHLVPPHLMPPPAPPAPPADPDAYPTNIPTRPPPEHRLVAGPLYNSLEDIEADLKQWARGCGFAVIRQHSRKSVKGATVRVDVACAKGRVRPSQQTTGTRQTRTYKSNCRWTAKLLAPKRLGGLWAFASADTLAPHNHDGAVHPAGLAPLRGFPPPVKDLIRVLQDVLPATKPRQIAQIIRGLHPDVVFTTKDIDNYRQKLRREAREAAAAGGGVPVQAAAGANANMVAVAQAASGMVSAAPPANMRQLPAAETPVSADMMQMMNMMGVLRQETAEYQ